MIAYLRLVAVLFLIVLVPAGVQAQNFLESGSEFQRSNPRFLTSFRPIVAKSSLSTVRVLCDGSETALGMVVGPDGWILTKANDLHGKITCRLRDGQSYPAQLVGIHYENDLAMLKIEAHGLVAVEWKNSKNARTGTWVALPGLGEDPVGIGIVSVPTRKMENHPTDIGYLGVMITGESDGVRVTKINAKSAADRAGLKVEDVVLAVEGQAIGGVDSFIDEMRKRKPGQIVTLKVRRGTGALDLHAILGQRPRDERSEFQNRLGGELSNRIGGYSSILQHDSVVNPNMCGGPIVDLEGKVIGINICRAGRTESWAVPSELVQGLLVDLMTGKLPPRGVIVDSIEVLRGSTRRAVETPGAARQTLNNALTARTPIQGRDDVRRRASDLNLPRLESQPRNNR